MDEIITAITSVFGPAFFVLAVVIYVLVQFQRKVIEFAFSRWSPNWLKSGTWQNKLWSEILLPSGPPGTGMLFTWLVTAYPYPDLFNGSTPSRIVWGIFAGFFSGYVYRMVKQVFRGYLSQIKDKFSAKNTQNQSSSSDEPVVNVETND
jgi:hypothetical protein